MKSILFTPILLLVAITSCNDNADTSNEKLILTSTETQTGNATATQTVTNIITETNTESETKTDTQTITDSNTTTNTESETKTHTQTITDSNTTTNTESETTTDTQTITDSNTATKTGSETTTQTQTNTDSNTFVNADRFNVPGKVEFEHYHRFSDSDPENNGGVYRNDAVDLQMSEDMGGGYNVGWAVPGEWLAYDINVAKTANYKLIVRVALNRDDTHLSVQLDGVQLKNAPVPSTGAWQQWADLEINLGEIQQGNHEFKFEVLNSAVNLNWFEMIEMQDDIEPPLAENNLRPGDAGVTFDTSKFDPRFPQMQQWITAGVRGGIPNIDSHQIKQTLEGGNSDDINAAITSVANNGGGAVYLKDGIYSINKQVTMKSNVVLIGQSRDKTVAVIDMENGNAFLFGKNVKHAGIYRLTMEGIWGKPAQNWNVGSASLNNELPDNENVTVMFKGSIDSWLDGVNIYNSGDFPVRCNATHITFRGLDVDGVHNKHGGAHGYFFILNGYNLITQSKMTHLRHISLQGDNVEYNVLFDNDFAQEVSYHSGDDGNNLIENNRIVLPADMPNGTNGPDYRAIMGPWSIQHHKSKTDNFNYNNQVGELNHNHPVGSVLSGNDKIYAGPIFDVSKGDQQGLNFPAMKDENGEFIVPTGNTLYPIVLTVDE